MNRLPSRMALLALATWLGMGVLSAEPQGTPLGNLSARSLSGQFVVYGPGPTATPQSFGVPGGDNKLLPLEPSLVAISCERIKQALADELGLGGYWQGKIFLSLHRARGSEEEIAFISERSRNGWNYRLNVPNPVEPVRFVRAVVQALLQEQANRTFTERGAEIPLWFSEGVLQQVLDANGTQVLLAPPQIQLNRLTIQPKMLEARHLTAAKRARQALGERAPLSLEELSWPKDNQLNGPEADVYRRSAQLFVGELLNLPDGRLSLERMLAELPRCYNWQTAFFRAFPTRFARQLDVEKWWSLQVVASTGRDPDALWSAQESWARLDEILQVPAEVRLTKTDLPKTSLVPLATVIQEWEFTRQAQVLGTKVSELNLARQRVGEDLLPLVDQYRQLLMDYLAQRNSSGIVLNGGKMNSPTAQTIQREVLKRLNVLEFQREKLKPAVVTNATATIQR